VGGKPETYAVCIVAIKYLLGTLTTNIEQLGDQNSLQNKVDLVLGDGTETNLIPILQDIMKDAVEITLAVDYCSTH
jgi:hypothetical protein